jgi:hypothetical protein
MKGASSFLMQCVKAFECFWFAQVIILSLLAGFSDAALACCKYAAANIPMTDATTMIASNIINIIGVIRIAVLVLL